MSDDLRVRRGERLELLTEPLDGEALTAATAPRERAADGSLVASARVLSPNGLRKLPENAPWQDEAWHYYDTQPEVRFGVGWLANALSRCRVMAAHRGEAGDEPAAIVEQLDDGEQGGVVDVEPLSAIEQAAFDLMQQLAGGTTGQSQMLADFGVHLSVPGRGYLVGEPGGSEDGLVKAPDTWQVVSSDELGLVQIAGGKRYTLKEGEEKRDVRILSADALAVQVWRPHRRWHYQADSPMRASLGVLRDVELLSQHIKASATSRLAGAGLLVLPKSLTFPVSDKERNPTSSFMVELLDAMITPLSDPGAPSAVVPLPIQVPDDLVDKIHHLKFSTPFDDHVLELRTDAIKRFAAGMDLPAEIVLGLADSNHWTAWQIDESALKLHVEPMLEAICDGLTVGYLRPALQVLAAQGAFAAAEIDDLIVWYDTSELTVRPDRSADAVLVYDRQGINVQALRRETGFDEADAPDEDELKRALLIDLVKGAPSLAPLILPALGIEVEFPSDVEPLPSPNGAPVLPSTGDDAPADGPPEQPDDAAAEAALVAACDALVWRALERGGAKLGTAAQRFGVQATCTSWCDMHTCVPEELRVANVDTMLTGAWDRVPVIADRYDVDPHSLSSVLDDFTRALVLAGRPYDVDELTDALGAV